MSTATALRQTLRDEWLCNTREADRITQTVIELDAAKPIEQETGTRTIQFIHGQFERLEGTLPATVKWNAIVNERYDGDETFLVEYPTFEGELDVELTEATRMSVGQAVKALVEDLKAQQEFHGEEFVPQHLYEDVIELEDALYRGQALSSFSISFAVENDEE